MADEVLPPTVDGRCTMTDGASGRPTGDYRKLPAETELFNEPIEYEIETDCHEQ